MGPTTNLPDQYYYDLHAHFLPVNTGPPRLRNPPSKIQDKPRQRRRGGAPHTLCGPVRHSGRVVGWACGVRPEHGLWRVIQMGLQKWKEKDTHLRHSLPRARQILSPFCKHAHADVLAVSVPCSWVNDIAVSYGLVASSQSRTKGGGRERSYKGTVVEGWKE